MCCAGNSQGPGSKSRTALTCLTLPVVDLCPGENGMLSKLALAWKSQWLESSHFEPFVERKYHLYINMMTVTEALLSALLTSLTRCLPSTSQSLLGGKGESPGRVKSCLSCRQLASERQPELQLSLSCASAKLK